MKIKKAIELVGKTPIVQINHLTDQSMASIYLKLEGSNLSGSTKVRPALYMIEGAIKDGVLKTGMAIIEPSSGNTGIALALIGKMKGFKVSIVMPDTMSIERRTLIKAYGADLILTDGSKGMSGAIAEAERLNRLGGYFMPSQFSNAYNVSSHYETTGLEIVNAFDHVDAFVSTVGTGGTITGVSRRLKERYHTTKIYAVEPLESQVLLGKSPGSHKIQGIGAGFVPEILDQNVIDDVLAVSSDEAIEMTRQLFDKEGLFVGISTGAAVAASIKIAKKIGPGKVLVTISPDTGEKYISNGIFA